MSLKNITIIVILLSTFFNKNLVAQDVIMLDSTTFEKVSTTAFGKAIVYAQRNVQLKKAGIYFAKVKEGDIKFSLNKNFYIDGAFSSQYHKRGISTVAIYKDGTEIFNRWTNGNLVLTRKVTVEKQGNKYLIVKTKVNKQDSTVEHYLNAKPL